VTTCNRCGIVGGYHSHTCPVGGDAKYRLPTYSRAILAETPIYGPAFTTSDGVAMEWVADMGTGDSGYAQVN